MTLVITRAKPEEQIDAARLMADTMAGFDRLALEVEIGNTPAIECYQRFGFVTRFTTRFGRHAAMLRCPGYHKMMLKI